MLAVFAHMIRSPSDAFWSCIATAEPPDLGQGPRANVKPYPLLTEEVSLFLAHRQIDSNRADRLRAAALLYNDHHDEAHDIVQEMTDIDGALIHGILHRREPDYWNAKYWFRRFVAHPAHVALGRRLAALAKTPDEAAQARALTLPGAFDPFEFVDACESAAKLPSTDPTTIWLRRVQHAEFEELVNHLLA